MLPKDEKIKHITKLVQHVISMRTMRKFLKPKYRILIRIGAHPHTGFCSIACDALRRLLGGDIPKFSGFQLYRVIHEGEPHYFLKTPEGDVLDPTVSQFQTLQPNYENGKKIGLPTPSKIPGTNVQAPTKAALEVLRQVYRYLWLEDQKNQNETLNSFCIRHNYFSNFIYHETVSHAENARLGRIQCLTKQEKRNLKNYRVLDDIWDPIR